MPLISFRQVDDRHVSAEVTLMEWSPSMDLIALATVQGEVFLHRLTWQKVWTRASPGGKEAEVSVTVLAWRPDGKVLAIGYDNKDMVLCDVEKGDLIHNFEIDSVITSLAWVPKSDSSVKIDEPNPFYEDLSMKFIPKLPSLSKTYGSAKQAEENADDVKKLKDQHVLNLLILGTADGRLRIVCFGIFKAGETLIDFEWANAKRPLKIITVSLSNDLSLLTILGEFKTDDEKYNYIVTSFSIPLLKEKHREMQTISQKYAEVSYLMTYLSNTIKAISEAWEDILLEIDSKLMNYAEAKYHTKSGTVSDDFLELLMFGTPSDGLENFLLQELTEKGLKKLGHSIELSYSNIQKLVLKHLQSIAQALFYHLSDLKGMALWEERFEEVRLDKDVVLAAVSATASFLLKATEIQQVIDSSMKNFKAFFRWLYAIILRLSDEPIPPEITKVTQQDLNFVAEFLKENFATEWNQEKKSTFSLERVGQYLKMDNLTFASNNESDNPWLRFLSSHPQIQENGLTYPYFPEKSFVKQHAELKTALDKTFEGPSSVLSDSLHRSRDILIFDQPLEAPLNLKTSFISDQNSEYVYSAFTLDNTPCKYLVLLRQKMDDPGDYQAVQTYYGKLKYSGETEPTGNKSYSILDFVFYSENVLTIIVLEETIVEGLEDTENPKITPLLIQFPVGIVWKTMTNCVSDSVGFFPRKAESSSGAIDAGIFTEKLLVRRLENMRATSFAVSGSRKVACVLFASRRRVRLFEMDVEDEEDEAEDILDLDDSTAGRDDADSSGNRSTIVLRSDDKENIY